MPEKSPASFYDSHSAFSAQRPSSHRGHRKASSMLHSISTPSSTTRNTTSSDFQSSLTPQTSLSAQPKGGAKKKKAKLSGMQDQVDTLTDEIGNIRSDVMSLCDSKDRRFMVKLEVKSENHRNTRKYTWLHDARQHEASQAIVQHQREQENRDAEIHLREVNIRVHQAHSMVLDKEAENLCLRIQYHQLTQGGSSGS
ncbi:hypothetical protein F4604DRAFT_1924135 [Suillus subluteus]|nr:hypothetical protein F4604DRAFT_1924135 [Suillus subluteus]